MWRRSPVLFSSWACSTNPRLKSSLVGGKAKKTDSPVLFPPVGAIFFCAAHTHLLTQPSGPEDECRVGSRSPKKRENCCVRPVTAHLNYTERLSQFSKHFLQDKKETLSSTTLLLPSKTSICGQQNLSGNACTTRVRKTKVRTTPVRSQQCECQQWVSRQQCERQKCERHQREARSANANSAKRQQCTVSGE